MILEQIPHQHKEEIAAELGFSVGFMSGKIASKTQTLTSRVARMKAVEKYILGTEEIGTPELTRPWIAGRVAARACNVSEAALFYIFSGKGWHFALTGSVKHLAGAAGPEKVSAGFSYWPSVAQHLSELDTNGQDIIDIEFAKPGRIKGRHDTTEQCLETISLLARKKLEIKQTIGFLAQRLYSDIYTGEQGNDVAITIASPLYIELL